MRDGLLDEVLAADDARRALLAEVEELRAVQNAASKEIGKSSPDERPAKIAAAGELKEQLTALEPALADAEAALRELALQVPNPADPSVPDGGEDDAVVVRVVGEPPADPGARPRRVRRADGVRRHRARRRSERLAVRVRDAGGGAGRARARAVGARPARGEGFVPVVPPVLVREHVMEEAGFFPTDRNQVYDLPEDGCSWSARARCRSRRCTGASCSRPRRSRGGTPAFSTNFRREAGTYGKDTRGIFRVHQFDKIEMFSFTEPDHSWEEHERILEIEESLVGGLGLPYRVVNIAAGDLGAPAAKKYDIEIWLPSEGRYRESHSCSNYLDFSARRLRTRVRGEAGTSLVHTLNGTACAISRTLVFLFEHYQQADGSFAVPDVLVPFTGFATVEAQS